MKAKYNAFALIEVVIVIVLISGSFLVFLEALNQAKSMQVRSEIVSIQSMLLHEKINEIRKAFTVKDDNKDYESLLIKLSDTKESTDNFFDNVVVNDENHDIKNNRLELLKMYCNTFDNFIDFSKLEGL